MDIKGQMQTKKQAFEKLARSKFRMRFHLGEKDLQYIDEKGMDVRQGTVLCLSLSFRLSAYCFCGSCGKGAR